MRTRKRIIGKSTKICNLRCKSDFSTLYVYRNKIVKNYVVYLKYLKKEAIKRIVLISSPKRRKWFEEVAISWYDIEKEERLFREIPVLNLYQKLTTKYAKKKQGAWRKYKKNDVSFLRLSGILERFVYFIVMLKKFFGEWIIMVFVFGIIFIYFTISARFRYYYRRYTDEGKLTVQFIQNKKRSKNNKCLIQKTTLRCYILNWQEKKQVELLAKTRWLNFKKYSILPYRYTPLSYIEWIFTEKSAVIKHTKAFYRQQKKLDSQLNTLQEQELFIKDIITTNYLNKVKQIWINDGLVYGQGKVIIKKLYSEFYVYDQRTDTIQQLACYAFCWEEKTLNISKPLVLLGPWCIYSSEKRKWYMRVPVPVYKHGLEYDGFVAKRVQKKFKKDLRSNVDQFKKIFVFKVQLAMFRIKLWKYIWWRYDIFLRIIPFLLLPTIKKIFETFTYTLLNNNKKKIIKHKQRLTINKSTWLLWLLIKLGRIRHKQSQNLFKHVNSDIDLIRKVEIWKHRMMYAAFAMHPAKRQMCHDYLYVRILKKLSERKPNVTQTSILGFDVFDRDYIKFFYASLYLEQLLRILPEPQYALSTDLINILEILSQPWQTLYNKGYDSRYRYILAGDLLIIFQHIMFILTFANVSNLDIRHILYKVISLRHMSWIYNKKNILISHIEVQEIQKFCTLFQSQKHRQKKRIKKSKNLCLHYIEFVERIN